MTPYRPGLRKRLWWWWTREVLDRIYIWRRTREIEAEAHASFLRRHPDYAAALKAGDRKLARVLLAKEQAAVMGSPSALRFLAAQLRAAGFSPEEIADAETMLENLAEEKPRN